MRLRAAISGDLDKYLKAELLEAEQAVTGAIRTVTTGLKNSMRAKVTAAGMVYTKAAKIMKGFEDEQVIKDKYGFWLAIPTPNAPKKGPDKRVTPGNLGKARGIRLRFVYRTKRPIAACC